MCTRLTLKAYVWALLSRFKTCCIFLFVYKISFNTVHVCKREGLIPFSVKILKFYSNFADDLQSSYTSSKQELVVTYKVCNLQAGDTEYLRPYLLSI